MFNFLNKNPKKKDLLGHTVKMMSSSIKVNFDFEAYAQKHIFNLMSKNSEYGFYYYPYGYLFRYPKWGTINEMGFRCKENTYEVRQAYPDRLIVAVFGGSTGFSVLLPDKETFSCQMEEILNNDEELLAKTGKKFKVVNLSHPGNVLINQIINYLLFCQRLNPDVVVSHYASNDLCTGQHTNRTFLSKYGICYVDVLEAWGRKIHDADDVAIDYDFSDPSSPDFKPVESQNTPQDIIRACHEKIIQFEQIVRASGAFFIGGFQPWISSKKNLSPAEESAAKAYNPYYQKIYQNTVLLMDMYEDLLQKEQLPYILSLHDLFKDLSKEITHFGDVVHMLPPGDRVIAEAYAKKIRSCFLNDQPLAKKESYEKVKTNR